MEEEGYFLDSAQEDKDEVCAGYEQNFFCKNCACT